MGYAPGSLKALEGERRKREAARRKKIADTVRSVGVYLDRQGAADYILTEVDELADDIQSGKKDILNYHPNDSQRNKLK